METVTDFIFLGSKITAEDDCSLTWQRDGETMETVTDFIFLGSKITVDGDCSHEIKRRLLLGRKAMTNLDSVLKSRDITLSTKVHIVKAMVFPVVMYGCESWTVKKAERRRTELKIKSLTVPIISLERRLSDHSGVIFRLY